MLRRFSALVAVLLLVALAVVFAAPWWTVHEIRAAARARDADALARHIDFPALRSNLKAEFAAKISAQQPKAPSEGGNDFASLLLAALVDPMVDALITPESLARMLAGDASPTPAGTDASGPGKEPAAESKTGMHGGYESPNRFALALRVKESGREPVVFLLHREGLLDWKLAGMRLEQLQAGSEAAK